MNVKKESKKTRLMWAILYLTAAIQLAFLLWDIQTGKAYIKDGTTLPHWSYIIVLVAMAKMMYEQFKSMQDIVKNKR